MVQNYKMIIAYDGTRFYGWEHQPTTDMTIQGKLENVLSLMVDAPVKVIGAGRTDAGVHAKAMVANAHFETDMSVEEIQEYMKTGKTELPKDFKEIMDQQIQDFVDKVYRYQTECGYSLDMVPVYFVGGGAVVMRNFGRYQQSNIHYVLDVKANAKGFETMAKIALRSGR